MNGGRLMRWALSLPRSTTLTANGSGGAGARLTIVRHHRVYPDGGRPLYRLGVSQGVFRAQLEMLRQLDRHPVTVSEGLAWLREARSGHRVAMSFDDGYGDNPRLALPMLSAAGGRATFYLAAGLIEDRRAPWWDEAVHALEARGTNQLRWQGLDLTLDGPAAVRAALAPVLAALRAAPAEQRTRLDALRSALGVSGVAACELAGWDELAGLAAAGMEVGAHTMTHPFLSLLGADEQAAEIGGSVELICRRLGVRPAGLAYPGGDHDGASIAAARACGLSHAVTTRAGDAFAASPPFALPRRGLSEGACMGPTGRFSRRLALAELDGAFDRLRSGRAAAEVVS